MASDLNCVNIIGRLVKDPEQRQLASGTSLASFRLASGRTYTTSSGEKKDETIFIDCTVWGKPADVIMKYTQKGKQLAIQGRLRQSTWQNTEGKMQSKIEIVVESFQFLGARTDQFNSPDKSDAMESTGTAPIMDEGPGPGFSDDDIPF